MGLNSVAVTQCSFSFVQSYSGFQLFSFCCLLTFPCIILKKKKKRKTQFSSLAVFKLQVFWGMFNHFSKLCMKGSIDFRLSQISFRLSGVIKNTVLKLCQISFRLSGVIKNTRNLHYILHQLNCRFFALYAMIMMLAMHWRQKCCAVGNSLL